MKHREVPNGSGFGILAMRYILNFLCTIIIGCGGTVGQEGTTVRSTSAPELGARKSGVDWPRFLGPSGDGRSPEKGILSQWSDEKPRIVWQIELGTSYGAPVISRGRLLHFDRQGNQAQLFCRKSESAELLWKFDYPTDYVDSFSYNNGPRCCPIVDGDRVYIFGVEGMLHCISLEEGKPIWQVNTKKEFGVVQNFFGVGSTPVVEEDLLIVQIGGSPPESPQTMSMGGVIGNGSGIVAFDKHTGKVRYQITNELASYSSPVLASIGQRRWCFVFARGGLVGFEPRSGKVDFAYPWRARLLESVNASNPVVVGDRVFVSETYGPGSSLLKVRTSGYEVVWSDDPAVREKSMQMHWNTPIHQDGFLYGCSGRHSSNAELRCIELSTGKVMWSETGLDRCSLLYVDKHFVCLSEYGLLLLLKVNPEKYDVVASLPLGKDQFGIANAEGGPRPPLEYPCWAAPVLSHGLLYVRGRNQLVCLKIMD